MALGELHEQYDTYPNEVVANKPLGCLSWIQVHRPAKILPRGRPKKQKQGCLPSSFPPLIPECIYPITKKYHGALLQVDRPVQHLPHGCHFFSSEILIFSYKNPLHLFIYAEWWISYCLRCLLTITSMVILHLIAFYILLPTSCRYLAMYHSKFSFPCVSLVNIDYYFFTFADGLMALLFYYYYYYYCYD